MITLPQFTSFLSRSLYTFLLDGTLKAHGVILEDTVRIFYTRHFIIGVLFTMQSGICYMIAPFATMLSQRLNPRLIAVIGGLLAGFGYIGRAVFPLKAIHDLLIFLSISGVGFGLVNVITVISLKKSYESRYPTAYSISMFASYIGVAVLPPLLSYLERSYGTQEGMFVLGFMTCSLIVTGLFSQLQRTPEDTPLVEPTPKTKCETLIEENGEPSYSETSQFLIQGSEQHSTAGKDAIAEKGSTFTIWISLFTKHPEFLLLNIFAAISDIQFASWSIFLVPYGEYLGIDPQTAVLLSTIGGISGLAGRVYCSVLFYWNKMNLILGFVLPTAVVAIGYTISLLNSTFLAMAIVSCLSGFGISVQTCASSSCLPSCVCKYHFEHAVIVYYGVGGVAILLAGLSTGAMVDLTGSYRCAFAYLTVLSLLQMVIAIFWSVCQAIPSPIR